jgi:hypothetical protein
MAPPSIILEGSLSKNKPFVYFYLSFAIARVFLIEPSQIPPSPTSKRKPPLTYEELQQIAENNGAGDIYRRLVEILTALFDYKTTTRSTIAFIGIIGESRNTIFSLLPNESSRNKGIRFEVKIDRLSEYLNIRQDELIKILPSESKRIESYYEAGLLRFSGFFKDINEVETFRTGVAGLQKK